MPVTLLYCWLDMALKSAEKMGGVQHTSLNKSAVESLAVARLLEILKDTEYLALNRNIGEFEKVPVTPEFLKALVKYPYVGFVVDGNVEECLYSMAEATLTKFLNKLRDNKPEGSTTERTALVFDIFDRYEMCMKADARLLENNKFNKDFVNSNAFSDVWKDILSVSQIITMSSLKDMIAFMKENGDLDDQAVRRGLLRRK